MGATTELEQVRERMLVTIGILDALIARKRRARLRVIDGGVAVGAEPIPAACQVADAG